MYKKGGASLDQLENKIELSKMAQRCRAQAQYLRIDSTWKERGSPEERAKFCRRNDYVPNHHGEVVSCSYDIQLAEQTPSCGLANLLTKIAG